MLLLHTELVIDSSHKLHGYAGQCAKLHGHTWFVDVWIAGEEDQLNTVGILFDFGEVKKLKEKYDHACLNDVIAGNPTAENLSMQIYSDLKEMRPDLKFRVRLYETKIGKETWCEYGEDVGGGKCV